MATIGTFFKVGGKLVGRVQTLTLDIALEFAPIEGKDKSPNGPDYRIFARGAEIGAACPKVSAKDKPYLSLNMDDPSFAAPMYATLIESEREAGVYRLLWERQKPKSPGGI